MVYIEKINEDVTIKIGQNQKENSSCDRPITN